MMVFQHRDGLVGYPKGDSSREFLIFFPRLCNSSSSSGLLCLVACGVVVGTFGCSLRGISSTLRVERALIVVLITIFFVAYLIIV
jgi:hypothetical protein